MQILFYFSVNVFTGIQISARFFVFVFCVCFVAAYSLMKLFKSCF